MIQIVRRHPPIDLDTGNVRHRDLIVVQLAERHAIHAHRDRAQLATVEARRATVLITAGHDALEGEEPAQPPRLHPRDLFAREEVREAAILAPPLIESLKVAL